MSMLTGTAGFFHSSSSLVTMSIPQAPWAGPSNMSILQAPHPGPSAQTTSLKPRATSVLKLQNSSRWTAIPALSKYSIHIEGISNYTVPDWQLPPESEDQLDLPIDTEDESSDLEIVDNEEEVDGSDNEQGDYITEEEAMQYATITLGEEIM
ncbi:hypothetical protein EV426DRAFT_720126 [Tirmania nivea]|nr:hypothetical protein EV426DRAFT_720126 [Tirmania nivea]